MSKRNGGFTLIEIMLAVAILAILAAIAIQSYEGHIGEARIGTAIKDIHQAELILNNLASDGLLRDIDGNTNDVRGLYLNSGSLVLGDPSATPAGMDPWLDPWDRVYRYRRDTANDRGVLTDASGNISNDPTATGSFAPQSYDLFSQGPDASDNNDDIVRGCNGAFVGVASDHPTC